MSHDCDFPLQKGTDPQFRCLTTRDLRSCLCIRWWSWAFLNWRGCCYWFLALVPRLSTRKLKWLQCGILAKQAFVQQHAMETGVPLEGWWLQCSGFKWVKMNRTFWRGLTELVSFDSTNQERLSHVVRTWGLGPFLSGRKFKCTWGITTLSLDRVGSVLKGFAFAL